MKMIIGLGNPGEKYKNTRHNVGFVVVDRLRTMAYGDANWEMEPKFEAVVCRLKKVGVLLAKPTTFMNGSGRSVKKLMQFYKVSPSDLYVVNDDLDILLGSFKIQKGKGPRQHNGVESVNEALGTRQYWHVRVGIENRPASVPLGGTSARRGKEYVLGDFTEEEGKIIADVTDRICADILGRIRS